MVAFLDELFTVLSEVVFRHGGTVEYKSIGDCVMAIRAPEDQPVHAVAPSRPFGQARPHAIARPAQGQAQEQVEARAEVRDGGREGFDPGAGEHAGLAL